jgi:hypothetical protein
MKPIGRMRTPFPERLESRLRRHAVRLRGHGFGTMRRGTEGAV